MQWRQYPRFSRLPNSLRSANERSFSGSSAERIGKFQWPPNRLGSVGYRLANMDAVWLGAEPKPDQTKRNAKLTVTQIKKPVLSLTNVNQGLYESIFFRTSCSSLTFVERAYFPVAQAGDRPGKRKFRSHVSYKCMYIYPEKYRD